MRTVFVRLAIRIFPAMLSMSVGCGHVSELLAYSRTDASARGSSANVALEQHTSLCECVVGTCQCDTNFRNNG